MNLNFKNILLFLLALVIIAGGLWWWFGSPRDGEPRDNKVYVTRSDGFTDPREVFNNTSNVKLFSFKVLNGSGSDIMATSSVFAAASSTTFDLNRLRNIKFYYNNTLLATSSSLAHPWPGHTVFTFNQAIPAGSYGEFTFVGDIVGTSTVTTHFGVDLLLFTVGAITTGTPQHLPVWRLANDELLNPFNPEQSVTFVNYPAN